MCLNPDFLGVFNPCEPNRCGEASCTVEDGVALCHGKSSNSISDIMNIIIPSILHLNSVLLMLFWSNRLPVFFL